MNNVHNEYIGYRVYDAQKSIAKCLEVSLKPYNITPGQWNLINQLDRLGKLSQKALAERTKKEQATITRYIDKLERMGLVIREPDLNDRRAYAIALTSKAKALLKETEQAADEASHCLTKDISQKELDAFSRVLQKIQKNADDFIEEKSQGTH